MWYVLYVVLLYNHAVVVCRLPPLRHVIYLASPVHCSFTAQHIDQDDERSAPLVAMSTAIDETSLMTSPFQGRDMRLEDEHEQAKQVVMTDSSMVLPQLWKNSKEHQDEQDLSSLTTSYAQVVGRELQASDPTLVRFVRIQLEGTNYLHLREVQVFDQNEINVALNKNATQSSNLSQTSLPASAAVNGNLTDFFHTSPEAGK